MKSKKKKRWTPLQLQTRLVEKRIFIFASSGGAMPHAPPIPESRGGRNTFVHSNLALKNQNFSKQGGVTPHAPPLGTPLVTKYVLSSTPTKRTQKSNHKGIENRTEKRRTCRWQQIIIIKIRYEQTQI